MRIKFKNLFGIPKEDVKPLCILMPFLNKAITQGLSLSERFSGKPYACFQHEKFTLIETRIGPLFTGDAVLNLKNSPCEKILFIGACGSLDKIRCPIGSIVSPTACYAVESFTQMLNKKILFEDLIPALSGTSMSCSPNIEPVQCASIGSIMLEDKYKQHFLDQHIDVLDMECASVFAASGSINLSASAFLYVTDIIGETSPYEISDPEIMQAIDRAQNQIAEVLKKHL